MVGSPVTGKSAREDAHMGVLLEKCRKGDYKAWSNLVDAFQRLVYSIPRRMGLSEDDSADVFQATFLALYRNLDRIENAVTLPKWLSVTASREALRLKRIGSVTQAEGDRNLDEIVADEEASAETNAVAATQSEELWKQVDRMDGRCRDLIRSLYSGEGMPYEEVSSKLRVPLGAIGPTRSRCLEKLRKLLEAGEFFK